MTETPIFYGWRVQGLDGDTLTPPFAARYWPDLIGAPERTAWAWTAQYARCLHRPEHQAPEPDCTCGTRVVPDLSVLLEACSSRTFAGSRTSILDECGVVARVAWCGRSEPGCDIPDDDPPGTVRVSYAWLLELVIHPRHADVAETLEDNYGVPVTVAADWPRGIDPEERFAAMVERLKLPGDPSAWRDLARTVVQGAKDGITETDAANYIWRQVPSIPLATVRKWVRETVLILAPEEAHNVDAPLLVKPITPAEQITHLVRGRLGR